MGFSHRDVHFGLSSLTFRHPKRLVLDDRIAIGRRAHVEVDGLLDIWICLDCFFLQCSLVLENHWRRS